MVKGAQAHGTQGDVERTVYKQLMAAYSEERARLFWEVQGHRIRSKGYTLQYRKLQLD